MKTVQKVLCVLLSILMATSCLSVAAFAANEEIFTSTYKAISTVSNKDSAKVVLDELDEMLKDWDIHETVDLKVAKLDFDITNVNALCKTIDNYDGILKLVVAADFTGTILGDLSDLNLKPWKNGLSRPNNDIEILHEFIELIGANKGLVQKVCDGSLDLGVFAEFVNLNDLLGPDGVSGVLKEMIIGFVYKEGSSEFKKAYSTYKNDIDSFIYGKLIPSFTEDYLPGLTVSTNSTVDSLLIDIYNIALENIIKPELKELYINLENSDIPELKALGKVLNLNGNSYDYSILTYSHDKTLKEQINTVIGNYIKNIVPGYTEWTTGGYDKLVPNIEKVIRYIAKQSGVIADADKKTLEQIGVELALIILKGGDFGAYEAGLEKCSSLQEMATALLINTANEMKTGVKYTGKESYLTVAGDLLAAWAYDNFDFTDNDGKIYRPGGGKDVFEVANYFVNYFLFDREANSVLNLSVQKKDSIFTKLDKLADFFGETKEKGVSFDSEKFFKSFIDCIFTLDIAEMLELTIVPILDNAGPVKAVKFIYNSVHYFLKNWAGSKVLPDYTDKAFTNALSNSNIGKMAETLLTVISARRSSIVTLATFAVALMFNTEPAKQYNIESASVADLTTTGKELTPVPTVKMNGKTLTQNADYIILTDTVAAPGTYKATIKGIGMYSGEIERSFNVVLDKVSTLSYSNPTTSSVKLTWGAVPYAKSYTVSVYNSAKKLISQKAGVTGTSYTVTGLSAGSEYTLSVQAVGSDSKATAAKTVTAYTLPSSVDSSKITTEATVSTIKLTWTAVTGATHYKVEKYASGKWTAVDTVTSTSLTVSELSAYTSYSFRITALKKLADGSYLYSSAVTVNATTQLGSTSSLKASATANSITLTWSKVANAEKYQVCQYKDGKWEIIKTLNETSYKISNLKADTQYKFSVRAIVGNSTYGSDKEISAYTLLSTPTKLKVSSTTATTAKLTWSKVSGASSYEVYAYISKKWKKVAASTSTGVTVKELPSGTNIKLKVKAISQNTDSAFSSEVTALTLPTKVSSLKASERKTTSIKLTWSKVANADKYQVRQYTNGKWKTLTTTAKTGYTVSKLKAGTKYKFSVRAVIGKSTYGSAKEISAYTLLPAPTKLKVSSTTTTTAKLSWSKVSGASSYEVYAYIGKKWKKVASTKNTSVTVKELPSGTKTKLKVKAISKNTNSAYSSEVTALTLVGKVSSLKASERKTNSIKLSWKKTTGATSYEIYRYTGKKWKKIGTTKNTNYTDSKSLSKNTQYQYKVRAVQKVDKKTTRYGDYSSVLKAKTTLFGTSRF